LKNSFWKITDIDPVFIIYITTNIYLRHNNLLYRTRCQTTCFSLEEEFTSQWRGTQKIWISFISISMLGQILAWKYRIMSMMSSIYTK